MAKDVTLAAASTEEPKQNTLRELRVHTLPGDPMFVLGFNGTVVELEADGVNAKKNALGKPLRRPAGSTWAYTRYYETDKPAAAAAIRGALGGAMFDIVKQAFIEAAVAKTDAEIQTIVRSLATRGVDLWSAIEAQAQKLEDRIAAKEDVGHRTGDGVQGEALMKRAGIPTV